jgi:surface carbohydrate biosynthesis protein
MDISKATLLIPIELQVRELDPKLLLACVAARRGFPSVIGPRREMHLHIPSFPKSIYLSKSLTSGSKSVFWMLSRLGHKIVAWDEEALVHLPPESYFQRRMSAVSMQFVNYLLAWGKDNEALWRQYPQMPSNLPIRITGNPRGDLLRPELRGLYDHDVEKLRRSHGNFVLINTNFNQVNAYYPDMNLLKPAAAPGVEPELSRRAIGMGMTREYAEGLTRHKQSIFEDFLRLIPILDQALTDHTIIIRPHPAENPDVYHNIAGTCKHVRVTNEGNVVPWLIAAKALIHNGCTTGVEAFALGLPTISYRASINEYYDNAFHRLPNQLSHECFDPEQIQETLAHIFEGKLGHANSDERKTIMEHHLAGMNGPLACDRMIDLFEEISREQQRTPAPAFTDQLIGRGWAIRRRIKKRIKGFKADMSHNKAGFLDHRYPGISREDLQTRLAQFQQALGDRTELKVEEIFHQFYRISAG